MALAGEDAADAVVLEPAVLVELRHRFTALPVEMWGSVWDQIANAALLDFLTGAPNFPLVLLELLPG